MSAAMQTLIAVLAMGVIAAAMYFAYDAGYLDPLIEQFGAAIFKAKALAEKEKLQAQGMKAGEDFVDEQLSGNQQADEVLEGVGSIGGLKKRF